MKKLSILFFTTLVLFAEEEPKHTFISDMIGSLLPIIVFFGIFIFVIKRINKDNGVKEVSNSNLELAKSNLKVATELKRIADALEKKEK